VELEYHPLMRRDLAGILHWYDERSDTAGDRFFTEFERVVEGVRSGQLNGYPLDQFSMKIRMRRFPYSISYELTEKTLFVFVIKHQNVIPLSGCDGNDLPRAKERHVN
jgi:plasmid stabilization system protein ParE